MVQAVEHIEPMPKNLRDYLAVVNRRKYQVLITAFIVLFLMALLAFGLPPAYRSSATILIEQQEIPEELVRSTVTSYADQRIQIISQRVMTSSNLWSVIEKFHLYTDRREKDPREVLVERMRSDIALRTISAEVVDPRSGRPTEATIAFTLSYESRSPATAQRVANELTSLFLNENLKTRTQMAADTSGFLTEEAQKLEREIAVLEKLLAEFKEKNINSLPELVSLNLTLMDKTERDLLEIERQIRLLEERKIYLKSELSQLNPASTVFSESGERILSSAGRLKVLEAEYIKLSATYSPEHPDIQKLKKEIAALRQELGMVATDTGELQKQLTGLRSELALARDKYSAEHPDVIRLKKSIAGLEKQLAERDDVVVGGAAAGVNADNPVYIQLQTTLNAANKELQSLNLKARDLKNKIADFEQRLVDSPQVEREYKSLTRDYQNATLKYQEIKAKEMEARLAESLEVERKGERFTLIEPPLLPEKPVKPNRKMILVVGFLFSVAGGIGVAFLLDSVDGNIHGRKAVANLLGRPPLASIPYIQTEEELGKKIKYLKYGVVSCVGACLFGAVLFHFVIMPIDTFWFVMLRRLGI